MKKHYDWNSIQEFYDKDHSLTDVTKEFGITKANLCKAARRGDLQLRTKSEAAKIYLKKNPRKHSEETKKKLSELRRSYLEKNPDKVPYKLNHSSKKSYPERIFETALIESGLNNFEYNYQVGIYQFDFAFISKKLDVEIDGGTHLTEKVQAIDQRRDKWSVEQGWKVLRFTAKEVKENPVKCVNKVKEVLGV